MAQLIVDFLEAVEIDQHYCGRLFIFESLPDAAAQQGPVGQFRQGIEMGKAEKAQFVGAAFGDVAKDRAEAGLAVVS